MTVTHLHTDEEPVSDYYAPGGLYEQEKQREADEEALRRKRANQKAEQVLEAEALAQVRGALDLRPMADFLNEPKPVQVIERVLAAEVNLLGGPSEAGKSLCARDWSLHVAAGIPWRGRKVQQRPILWVASEGMHDADERWGRHPLWEQAKGNVYMLDPVNLTSESDVDWLIEKCTALAPGIITFDVIYGMGMADDNGVKDALPVISSMKRVSAELQCATLALGHPPHGGDRRFRGTSMWRQLAYTEWHMAEGRLTCEKSKIADKSQQTEHYAIRYPSVEWLTRQDVRSQFEVRSILLDADFEDHPKDSDRARAERLAPALGVSEVTARRYVADHRKGR